jgi:hypothetical protein
MVECNEIDEPPQLTVMIKTEEAVDIRLIILNK